MSTTCPNCQRLERLNGELKDSLATALRQLNNVKMSLSGYDLHFNDADLQRAIGAYFRYRATVKGRDG